MSNPRENMAVEELRGYATADNPLRPLLDELFLIDNGSSFLSSYYPKAWLEGFREEIEMRANLPLEDLYGKLTTENVAAVLTSSATNEHGAIITVQNALSEWRAAEGQTPKLFTGTVDYFATGEGRTLHLVPARAYSASDFLINAVSKVGGYYSLGMTIYEGLPDDTDAAANLLLSANLRALLDDLDAGSLDAHLHFHINLS